jgi:hypothetical protein
MPPTSCMIALFSTLAMSLEPLHRPLGHGNCRRGRSFPILVILGKYLIKIGKVAQISNPA